MNKSTIINIILIFLIILISVIPLIMNKSAEFSGADGQAGELIEEINPGYTPWFDNIWSPPSGEIESLLFALQAVIGSAIIFFIIGYYKGKYDVKKGKIER